jgi:hypothetical protein
LMTSMADTSESVSVGFMVMRMLLVSRSVVNAAAASAGKYAPP